MTGSRSPNRLLSTVVETLDIYLKVNSYALDCA